MKLIVVDFDNTLIPFDSFRKYFLFWMRYYPLKLSILLIKKKFNIITLSSIKSETINTLKHHKNFEEKNNLFVSKLLLNIRDDILKTVLEKKDDSTVILLLSASPDYYISKVAKKLGMEGKGSYFKKGVFIHLHGKGKLQFLKNKYPKSKYKYEFSISDSNSDIELLREFNDYKLID